MRATRRPTGPAGHWRRALGKALAVAVGFLLLAAGVAAQRSLGGSVDLWGSVGLEVDHRRLDDVSSQTAATLAAHLEGHLARGPWQVALTAEPRLPLAGAGTPVEQFSLGLIEGYLAFRAPLGDLQLGQGHGQRPFILPGGLHEHLPPALLGRGHADDLHLVPDP